MPWNDILRRAVEIVNSYDTGVTLRQLYYRLVSEGLMPNRQQSYKTLSAKTAAARREGWFPALIDRTRDIERFDTWESPEHALDWLTKIYRRPRDEGQEWSIYIGVEKHGLTTQLMAWFANLGIPVMALGGYSSQTFVDVVANDVHGQKRKSVLLYAGDFDASGMDIDRDFIERAHIFDETVRVALTADIVRDYNLPPMPGKAEDSRSARFMLEHGELVQVELDALAPNDLRTSTRRPSMSSGTRTRTRRRWSVSARMTKCWPRLPHRLRSSPGSALRTSLANLVRGMSSICSALSEIGSRIWDSKIRLTSREDDSAGWVVITAVILRDEYMWETEILIDADDHASFYNERSLIEFCIESFEDLIDRQLND